MAIDALYCVSTFYSLEALELLVVRKAEFGKHSHDKLIQDIKEFKERYVKNLSQALYDYTAMVVYGEMRHAWKTSTHYNPHVCRVSSRKESYYESLQYNPKDILEAGKRLFDPKKTIWTENFGGEKWWFIADRVSLYGRIGLQNFCDMCFSLSHNTSPYLDKFNSGIFMIDNKSTYKRILDLKFEADNPLEVIVTTESYLGYRLRRLVERAFILKLIPIIFPANLGNRKPADCAENYIYNYKPIVWGGNRLECVAIEHRHSLNVPSGYSIPEFKEKIKLKQREEEMFQMKLDRYRNTPIFKVGDVVEVEFNDVERNRNIKAGMTGVVTDVNRGYSDCYITVRFSENIGGEFEMYSIHTSQCWFKKHKAKNKLSRIFTNKKEEK